MKHWKIVGQQKLVRKERIGKSILTSYVRMCFIWKIDGNSENQSRMCEIEMFRCAENGNERISATFHYEQSCSERRGNKNFKSHANVCGLNGVVPYPFIRQDRLFCLICWMDVLFRRVRKLIPSQRVAIWPSLGE